MKLLDLLLLAGCMLSPFAKENVDYWFYEIDPLRVMLINHIHRN